MSNASVSTQLSSVSTSLNELQQRVTSIAEAQSGASGENVAATLFEVERALATAARRLDQLLNDLV